MARAGLGLSATDLAERAGVSYPTLNRFEKGKPEQVSGKIREQLERVLREAGAEFGQRGGRVSVSVSD